MKKTLLTLILLVGMVFGLMAQKLTYQAVVRDNNQQLVVNTAVKATVTIAFSTGNPYTTEVNGSTNLHGLLSFEFGDATLNGRDWTGATIAVKVVKANDESIVYVNEVPRPVSAVPYALSVDGQSIQNYLTEHNYVDLTKLNDTLGAYSTTAVMDARHYLTSDSAVIKTMQGNITTNANSIANLTLHTAKAAIRDSVAGQIHDSIAPVADKAHTHDNKALLDNYTQTEPDLAEAVAKKHSHDNMAILNATEAPYTDADSAKLHDIADGAQKNVQSDWKQGTTTADDYIKNKPSITDTVNNILTTGKYVTETTLDARHYLRSDSTVITTIQDDITANATNITSLQSGLSAAISKEKTDSTTLAGRINALENASMDCNAVKNCIKDTLSNYTPTADLCNVIKNCDLSANASLNTLLDAINAKIDSLARLVDSLSKLPHGGGDTPTVFTCGTDKVKDVDNNEYPTVQIGNQCWMAQNLRTKLGTDGDKGYPTSAGADSLLYGRLYTWNVVTKGASTNYTAGGTNDTIVHGICPAGWHVPSNAEWDTLTTYVKSKPEYQCNSTADNIANALSSPTGWQEPSECAAGYNSTTRNATGFSAVPAGSRFNGDFYEFGYFAYFWSATQCDVYRAWYRNLDNDDSYVDMGNDSKDNGLSVRCLRDAGVGGGDTPDTPGGGETVAITFQPNGAMGTMESQTVTSGVSTPLNANVFNRTTAPETDRNWEFIGWNTKADGTGDSYADKADVTFDSDTTLYAQWHTWCTGTSTANEVGTDNRIDSVKDVDYNKYAVVKIGNQCWMAQNLRTTTGLTENTNYWHAKGQSANDGTYGLLYNWAAMMQGKSTTNYPVSGEKVQGICPAGWHVPSNAEWDTLTTYVKSKAEYKCGESADNIAKALSSTTGWNNNETACNVGNAQEDNNATGFSAVPAGSCVNNSKFYEFGNNAYFWSATQNNDNNNNAWYWPLRSGQSGVNSVSDSKVIGFSVRCLRDAGVGGGEPAEPCTPTSSTHNIEITPSQLPYVFGDTTFKAGTTAGTYTLHRTNAGGCDSTITINLSFFTCGTDKVMDVDYNEYNTVQIGNQCWMKENMKTTKYADGQVISSDEMFNPNDSGDNVATYGKLYTWSAATRDSSTTYPAAGQVKVQGICPAGWHVPSDAEWTALTDYVNTEANGYRCDEDKTIAKALASKTGWTTDNTPCAVGNTPQSNNLTGFSAVPAGYYFSFDFDRFGKDAYFWSAATQSGTDNAYCRKLESDATGVSSYSDTKDNGFSVRCLRDAGVGGGDTPDTPGGETANVDTVTCYSNLGAKESVKDMVTRGQNFGLSTVSFTHPVETNWEIASWNTKADGTGTSYATNATFTTTGNLTLYAQWHTWCTGTPNTTVNEFGGSNRIDSLKDSEGNKYAVVKIGNQCWMAQNLRTTTGLTENTNYWHANDKSANDGTYGLLYNWAAMMQGKSTTNYPESGNKVRGICPAGWHVPSDVEWTQLTDYVKSKAKYICGEGADNIAKALSSKTGWIGSGFACTVGCNPEGNNLTGFSAVPAGGCGDGRFYEFGMDAYFWSATQNENQDGKAWYRDLVCNESYVASHNDSDKVDGHSVRCLRD